MAGGGGDVVPVSTRTQQPSRGGRRGHRQNAAWLPLDIIIAEIAARSDPATFVRCAATCRDARRRIVEDPGRLRLRDMDRFVLPLLRGHLTGITTYTCGEFKTDVYMVDTTAAADATRLVKATFTEADDTLKNAEPLDSRGGLVLVRNYTPRPQLLVCNLATHRSVGFPDDFPGLGVQYVLLIGGSNGEGARAGAAAAVGQPFQVLKAKVVSHSRTSSSLLMQTFSSEHGTWSPLTEIMNPNLYGISNWSALPRPLVVGDVVHWLCLTNSGSYVLMLHVRAARVNVTSLPACFPRDSKNHPYDERRRYLLATASAGGNPVVLLADTDKVSAWEQSRHTKIWKPRPQVVIQNKTILAFKDDGLAELVEKKGWGKWKYVPELLWFGERSGTVLLRIHGFCLLWLDLHSKKIVRCFSSDHRMSHAQVYCPYEVDLSSWVPTFSNVVTF